MCIIHRRTPRQCNDDVIVRACSRARARVCTTFFERRLGECVMMSALRQQLYPSLWRWQSFSPIADSTGAMDRFACCLTRTSSQIQGTAVQYFAYCMFVCLFFDGCLWESSAPLSLQSAVPSALLSSHLYRKPRIQCRLGSFLQVIPVSTPFLRLLISANFTCCCCNLGPDT